MTLYMHDCIYCIVLAVRMCDSIDPAKAAELYITASEMNVVRNYSLLLYKYSSVLSDRPTDRPIDQSIDRLID